MIKAEHVTFEYFRRDEEGNVSEIVEAVKELSLHVRSGEFIGILGQNGSGKSTFAKMLNALLMPSEGSIIIAGLDSADSDNRWKIRKNAGMVFQNPDNQIIGTMVEEDVAFGPENLGIKTEEISERVAEALETVGMTAYRQQSPNHLSGGQK
ncbi:MAG: ATP-binding cassette domain-containing protein, partial [Lachnospiraceae bacterium]|nr:ATP-binding cassette domain-containing protein [Lachnospiraceae bacterium]